MCFWNSSGVLDMPKGNLLKRYLPNGVRKVVKWCDSVARGICQNPLLTSNLVEQVAPASWANASSTLGSRWISIKTLSFNAFKSTQMWTEPFALGMTTIPAHHGVGSSTWEILPTFHSIKLCLYLLSQGYRDIICNMYSMGCIIRSEFYCAFTLHGTKPCKYFTVCLL